ncbi:MAG: polysaccharide export protein, partial [Streptococcaceae bacterium]|nr:polysaccharide export protein [Streptococcaceae bacterium]
MELSIKKQWIIVLLLLLSGCSSISPTLPASGASRTQVEAIANVENDSIALPIPVIDIDSTVTQQIAATQFQLSFAQGLSNNTLPSYRVGSGDTLQVSIWETPPATLFGTLSTGTAAGLPVVSTLTTLPDQIVDEQGQIEVPFAGSIKVTGRFLQQVEAEITKRLARKANQPQVTVRVTRNVTSVVTVVGEVKNSTLVPLTPKGERLLDVIAMVGGVNQPVNKTTIQISRNGKVLSMPLNNVIQDPLQNIRLHPGDVITALFQSNSFIVLGATGR